MHIAITPITQFNSFVKEPNGLYTTSSCIGYQAYTPIYKFEEVVIDGVVDKLKELLQYFKGEHSISIHKLVRCEPYEYKPRYW